MSKTLYIYISFYVPNNPTHSVLLLVIVKIFTNQYSMGTHESEGTVAGSEQSPAINNSYTLAGKYKVNVSSGYINPMLQMGE